MNLSVKLDALHYRARANRWMRYFTTFTRLALAAGFLPAGYVKIIGERFTDLHNNQPMGHYLEALHHTVIITLLSAMHKYWPPCYCSFHVPLYLVHCSICPLS